jgi:catechol 2,3-dioxygenase-like lactoylglutathione lyase family enzyme
MNIVGPDDLVFGVENLDLCAQYLRDYGLAPTTDIGGGLRFEALDGTGVILRSASDPTLPPRTSAKSQLRETIYGVRDEESLNRIAGELGRDRDVPRGADGSFSCIDDMGFALRFRLTRRRPYTAPPDLTNAPGTHAQRPPNQLGVRPDMHVAPRTLSHVVLFVPDAAKAEKFYARIGFRTTDRFTGVGPFMRPAGSLDHHTLFMIQTPPFLKGLEHFTFHVGSATELMLAGARFESKGHETFWGPGRHVFGSNWFWYFNSPLGCHVEYDADMDLHDDSWVAREAPSTADTSQLFLFANREKWFPSGAPPK